MIFYHTIIIMIFTNLKDELQNKSLSKKIQYCIDYTNKNIDKIRCLESGVYELESNVKMHVNIYETGTEKGKILETHLKNLDVQIMIEGEEYIAFNNIHNNMIVEKIEKDNDLIIYSGKTLFNVLLKNEDVLVLYPEDVHMPGLQVNKPAAVRKLVFKIPIEILD